MTTSDMVLLAVFSFVVGAIASVFLCEAFRDKYKE